MKKKYVTGILAIFCLTSLINATIAFGQTSPNAETIILSDVGSSVRYTTVPDNDDYALSAQFLKRSIGTSSQTDGKTTYRSVLYFNLNSGLPASNCILKEVYLQYWTNNGNSTNLTKVVTLSSHDIGTATPSAWYSKIKNSTPVIWSDKSFASNPQYFFSNPLSSGSQRNLWNQVQIALGKPDGSKVLSLGISMVDDENQTVSYDIQMKLVLIYEMHYKVVVKNSYITPPGVENNIIVDKNDNNGFQPYPSGTEFNLLLNQNIQIKTNTPVPVGEVTYEFANWSNNPGNLKTQNPYTLKVTKGETWTATFNKRVNVSFWNKENTANLTNSQLLLDEVDQLTSGDPRSLAENTPHTVRTLNETWDNNRIKHNNWNNVPSEYKLSHVMNVDANKPNDIAQFKELKPVTVTPTIKGVPVAGSIEFNDPWFVESDGTTQPGYWKPYSSGLNASTLPKGGVFLNQSYNSTNPYYKIRTTQTAVLAGLDGTFLNWSSSNGNVVSPNNLESPVIFNSTNDVVYANYGAQLVSAQGTWVQSVTPYTANGTRAVAYFSPDPNVDTGIWFHQENGSVGTELNISSDGFINLTSATSLVSLAVADYNKQKSYVGYFAIQDGYRTLSIREIVNGVETGFTQTWATGNNYNEDPMLANFSSNAKLFITSYEFGAGFPTNYSKFLIVVVDGLTVYTRSANMNNGLVYLWDPWSSFSVSSNPTFATNGKSAYINWIQNGSLVGRRFYKTSWGSTYTLYSNSGGNFTNFTATVNETDDLLLMMTRQNGLNSRSMCFGKRYFSGSSAPVTVLETQNFTFYKAYSLALENGKMLASIGKSPDGEDYFYYLWKHDGTSWTKETTSFSSTPSRLLHNEVDVRPYEFVTSTTPALYALKTTPVSWPAGSQMNKEGDENGFSIVAAQIGDTLNWYTTVSPEAIDSIVIDSTGIWSIVVNQVSAKNILISGLNRFGSAVWVDTSSTVLFSPATARYTFWVVDPAGNKMRYHKESSESDESEFVLENKISVFPNPFNPTTVFSVSVAEPSTVKLHVFNLIGQQIAEVVNADLNAGVHDYRLNAGSWSSGTYFYRLQIGDKMQTGKIQLVK
ncbi:MAG: T9SS type A sorting domain-containing protein [Bacteroidetes bacterium]|nr:T9SS type A sorting domain-containing protein [Bacteroidota bacterium]